MKEYMIWLLTKAYTYTADGIFYMELYVNTQPGCRVHILLLRIDMQSTHAFRLLGENASNVQDQPTIILNPLPAVTPLKTGFALLSRFAFIDSLKICGCVFSWRARRAAISAMESWGNWTCNFLIPIMNDLVASGVQMMNVRNQSCC